MSANIFGSAEDISSTNTTSEASTIRSGRTRVFGVYLDSGTTSGDFHLRDGGSGGTLKFKVKTPAAVGGLTIKPFILLRITPQRTIDGILSSTAFLLWNSSNYLDVYICFINPYNLIAIS